VLLQAIHDAIERSRVALRLESEIRTLRRCYDSLTPRERQVLRCRVRRLNKQIAGELGISEITVKMHRGQVMRKMKTRFVPTLVTMADRSACGESGRLTASPCARPSAADWSRECDAPRRGAERRDEPRNDCPRDFASTLRSSAPQRGQHRQVGTLPITIALNRMATFIPLALHTHQLIHRGHHVVEVPMIHREPNTTNATTSTPNASASTLLVLSGRW